MQTKQQHIDELKLKVKELELKLDAEELSRKSLRNELEDRQEAIRKDSGTIRSLRIEVKDLKRYKIDNTLLQIARLEAVKMLFSFIEGGSTHRQKEMFATQAKEVIEKQIDQLRYDIKYNFIDSDNLPF
jgi:hypothetical protein